MKAVAPDGGWLPLCHRSRTGELTDLFEGRRQLIVYHHTLRPADPQPCSGCAMVGGQIPYRAHLHARDTTLTFVSRAPLAEILAFHARMGWSMPWAETTDSFSVDLAMGARGPGFTVFIRDGDGIYHSHATTGRGTEMARTVWGLLDMTPMGRQGAWQDAPDWVPRGATCAWWRLRDRQGAEGKAVWRKCKKGRPSATPCGRSAGPWPIRR